MCSPAAGGVTQMIGGFFAGSAAATEVTSNEQAYRKQSAVERYNATLYEAKAKDAEDRGQQAEFAQRLKQSSIEGTQRATFAARGVDLNEGSALNILHDTRFIGDVDAATLHDNAAREAWSLRAEAYNRSKNADLLTYRADNEVSPNTVMLSSLLGSGGQVASKWYGMSGTSSYSGGSPG